MMLKFVLPSVILFITAVSTKTNATKFCCYPDEWECTENLIFGIAGDDGEMNVIEGTIAITMDAPRKRLHVAEVLKVHNMIIKVATLTFYNLNVQYTIQDNTCKKTKPTPWNNVNCISDKAIKVKQYKLGFKQSIQVEEYAWTDGDNHIMMSVEADTCTPIFQQQYGVIQEAKFVAAIEFQNLTIGIKDEHIFDIPAICKGKRIIERTWTGKSVYTLLL